MSVLQSKQNSYSDQSLFDFTHGIDLDARLAVQEVRVQKAWAEALSAAGYLEAAESQTACGLLDQALALMQSGAFEWRKTDEDIHMNLERFITEQAGDLGKKIHLGRSRNDLIATTLRLFINDSLTEVGALVEGLQAAFEMRAAQDADITIPGLTHLQHGQPVPIANLWGAYHAMLGRDLALIRAAQATAMAVMPLGSAAMAGTHLQLDQAALAKTLGFASPHHNPFDSVGDRDFILQALSAFAHIATHLSRLSEDVIYMASTAVSLLQLPQDWSTGSSIMPNKRNPDVSELTRARTCHVIAAANNGFMLTKAVTTCYGSDFHELKRVYLRALDDITACLTANIPMVKGLQVNKTRAEQLLNIGHIHATRIANQLVETGVPFRQAYKQVAAMVEEANQKGCQVHEL